MLELLRQAGRRSAAEIVRDFRGHVVNILSAWRAGERDLLEAEQIDELESLMRQLRRHRGGAR
jgi:hypothetical protein